jgi:hypothetical protein
MFELAAVILKSFAYKAVLNKALTDKTRISIVSIGN